MKVEDDQRWKPCSVRVLSRALRCLPTCLPYSGCLWACWCHRNIPQAHTWIFSMHCVLMSVSPFPLTPDLRVHLPFPFIYLPAKQNKTKHTGYFGNKRRSYLNKQVNHELSRKTNSKPYAPWTIKVRTYENWAVDGDTVYHRLGELSFHLPNPLHSQFDVSPILFYSWLLQPPKYLAWHLLRRSHSQQTLTGLETVNSRRAPNSG